MLWKEVPGVIPGEDLMDKVGEEMKVVDAKDSYLKRIEWYVLASLREASGISTVIVDKINQYVSDTRRGLMLLLLDRLKRVEKWDGTTVELFHVWNIYFVEKRYSVSKNWEQSTKYSKLYMIFSRALQ